MSGESEEDGTCPADDVLHALIAGDSIDDAMWVEEHLGECDTCSGRIERFAGAVEFETEFAKAGAQGGHESVELSQLIEHLKVADPAASFDPEAAGASLVEKFPAGAVLDGYRIDGLIARGGMGVVLKAFDLELERPVAIKLLDPSRAGGKAGRERFVREARAAAAIDHENVLPIFTVGQTGDLPYIVMPLVEGGTLQDKVERDGALDAGEVARIAGAVSRGLAAAHSAGLVHRDVKPANILLEPDGGRVWIADFGLARAIEDPSLTRQGATAGTPQFMSPEQADGGEADERSDLFSLGAVTYYMLAGKPPFDGSSALTVLRQVADSTPDWSKADGTSVPSWLSNLTRRLMSKSPADRPLSAVEVATEIQKCGRPANSKLLWVFALAAVALVVWAVATYQVEIDGPQMAVGPTVAQVIGGEAYPDLAEAIAAAPPGGAIELWTGVIDTELLGVIDKPLTLRAKAEAIPELTRTELGGPVLDLRAAVHLEGIRITQSLLIPVAGAGEFLPPLVRVGAGGDVTLTNCTLMRPRPGKSQGFTDGSGGGPPFCVEVCAGGALAMERSVLVSASSVGVAVLEGSRVEISECVFGCEYGIYCDGKMAVALERSSFLGLTTLMVGGDGGAAEVTLESNALLSVGAVLWTREALEDTGIELRSGGNLYCPQKGYAVAGQSVRVKTLPAEIEIRTLARWREFAGEAKSGSIELPPSRVLQMIRRYSTADLQPAPELALEKIRSAFRLLRENFPQMGCDVDAAGADDLP